MERAALDKPVHQIMQRENDLYEPQEDLVKDIASCRQIITRVTNTSKKGKGPIS
jgi:hypothetical protein